MDLVQTGFRALIRASVRSRLRGVWLRGALPSGGAVMAANHHGWWDGYVIGELMWTFGGRPNVLMDETQLARFPFFRDLGVLGAHELRPAVRRAKGGEPIWIFPEGRLNPAGPPGELRPGAAWLARAAGVPLVPVAIRTALRGHEFPEAFVRIGAPTNDLARDLPALVAALDAELADADPERPLPGYLRLAAGRRSSGEALDLPSRALAWVLERRKEGQ